MVRRLSTHMKTPAMFAIGSPEWPGLSKLSEEAGEVTQVIGKLMGTGGEVEHWDGTNLRTRLIEETGDVLAAAKFVASVNGFSEEVHERAQKKLDLFFKWHRENEEPTKVIPTQEQRIDELALRLRDRLIALWGSTPRQFQQVDAWLKWIVGLMGGVIVINDWRNPWRTKAKRPFWVSAYSANDNFDLAQQIGTYAFGLEDWESRRFASTFLMPPDEFKKAVELFDDLYIVAGHFGCPYGAVVVTKNRMMPP